MKKILLFILLITTIFISTGCFKRDTLEDIEIITTVYPVEYVTNYLYGDHSIVTQIYPDNTDTFTYSLSEKQYEDNAKKKLFIYNGVSNEKDIASALLNINKKLLIIDATSGIDITYDIPELWLNPSHLLMMSQNIKNGLDEYISNAYLKKEIENQYEKLKVELSELDAEIKITEQNAKYKTIVVATDGLKFLEKYGFEIISLDDKNNKVTDKSINEVKKLIKKGEVSTILNLKYNTPNEITNEIIKEFNIPITELKRLDTISEEDRDNKKTYITIMNENIDIIKKITYDNTTDQQ